LPRYNRQLFTDPKHWKKSGTSRRWYCTYCPLFRKRIRNSRRTRQRRSSVIKKSGTSRRWYCTVRFSGNVPEIQGEPAGADQAQGGEAATGPGAGGEEAATQHGASQPRSK
jgi:hypothetical protein